MNRTCIAVLSCVIALSACNRSQPDQPAVAEVGDSFITTSQFTDAYRRHIAATGITDSERERASFVDGMINKRLLVMHARETGLYDASDEEEQLDRIRQKLLLDAYTGEVVYAGLEVTEEDMIELFGRMNTTVTARHLYSPTLEGAEALRERLDSGETFETLAHEVFSDPTLANNGGSVGSFTFDEMDLAFEDAAFALKIGEVSEPVRTAQGYSLIQVEERFTQPIVTASEFAERKGKIAGFVRFRQRVAARTRHVNAITDQLNIDFEESALGQLVDQITAANVLSDDEIADFEHLPLVSFGDGSNRQTWTVAEFREHASTTTADQRENVVDDTTLRQFLEGLLVRQEMIDRAERLGLGETDRFEEVFELAREDWTYERFRNMYKASISVDPDSVEAYFNEFGHEFRIPAKVRVQEILLETNADAKRVAGMTGTRPFDELAREYSIRDGAELAGGDLGYVTREQLGVLADTVFASAENTILGPIEIAGRYVILRVAEHQPSRPATLDETRADIESQIRTRWENELLKKEIAHLRVSIGVKIDWVEVYSAPLSPHPKGQPFVK